MHTHQLKAKVALYKISRCGFFTRKKTKLQTFGNITDVFSNITSWVKNANTVLETATFECEEDSSELPVYCHDIHKRTATGNFGIVLWNKTTVNGGAITAIRASEPSGSVPIELAEQDDDLIPGIPTYFWVSPTLGFCAAIRFDGTFSGVAGFSKYIPAFMQNHSKWKISMGGNDIYWDNALGKPGANYFPKFTMRRKRDPLEVRRIYSLQHNIRKVICKDVLKQADNAKEDFWQRLLGYLTVTAPRTLPYDIPIKTELSYCPTEAEIKAIISRDVHTFSQSNDIGFMFTNDPKIYWLSGIYDRREFTVIVESTGGAENVFSASSIVKSIDETLFRGVM